MKCLTDYYTFGGTLPGRMWQDAGGDYRYGYQGQEKNETDVNWDNFELRTYNHDLGRWSAPDPYGQFHSPYLAMGNNPVNNIDPDGGFVNGGQISYSQQWDNNRRRMNDDYLRMMHWGKYSDEALYASYLDKFSDLNAQGWGQGSDGGGAAQGAAYLNALYSLNNEYIGMGLAGSYLASGVDRVSGNTASVNSDLITRNTQQNGEYEIALAASQAINDMHKPMSSGDLFDANWISSTRAATKNRIAEFLNNASAKNQAEYDAKKASEVNEAGEEIVYHGAKAYKGLNKSGPNGKNQKDATLENGRSGSSTTQRVDLVWNLIGGTESVIRQETIDNIVAKGYSTINIDINYISFLAPDFGDQANYDIRINSEGLLLYSGNINAINGGGNPSLFPNISFNQNGGTLNATIMRSNGGWRGFDNCYNIYIDYTITGYK